MTINLTPIIKSAERAASLPIDGETDVREVLDGITPAGPARYSGEVKKNGENLSLNLHIELDYGAECDRCLAPVKGQIRLTFRRKVVKASISDDEFAIDGQADEVTYDGENLLDIEELVADELIAAIPSKHLCSAECKGLCPKCGADLNAGDCGCKKGEINPIWEEILSKLK
jgi:uncharacterized protein